MLDPVYAIGGPAWTVTDASTPGAVLVVDDPTPPEGTYRVLSWGVRDVEGLPRRWVSTETWSIENDRATWRAELDQIMGAKFEAGFPCTLNGVDERLQLRGADDKINWEIFRGACQDMIDENLGGQTNPQAVRCASNVNHFVTGDEGKALCQALRNWGGAILARSWGLKDAIAAATDRPDLESGWPS